MDKTKHRILCLAVAGLLILLFSAPGVLAWPCNPPDCPECETCTPTGCECLNECGCNDLTCPDCWSCVDCSCSYDCPIDQTCCNGTCFNFYTHMCCGGHICRQPGCSSWDCRKCVDGVCVACLSKPPDYEELTGCSGTIVDDPATEPQVNGCSVPYFLCYLFQIDCENPAGCEHTSFSSACEAHDICYQTCGSGKDTCDNAFHGNMFQVCNALTGQEREECYDDCATWRERYWYGVVTYGDSAWENDQVEACACCECN